MDCLGIFQGSATKVLQDSLQIWGGKHVLYPCGQQQCDKSQDPFLPAPERDLSGVYSRCKTTPHSNDPFQTFQSPPRHNAILRGATTQPHHNHLSQKEPSSPKPQTTLAQAPTPGCSFWSPTTPPCVALFCGARGQLSNFPV